MVSFSYFLKWVFGTSVDSFFDVISLLEPVDGCLNLTGIEFWEMALFSTMKCLLKPSCPRSLSLPVFRVRSAAAFKFPFEKTIDLEPVPAVLSKFTFEECL